MRSDPRGSKNQNPWYLNRVRAAREILGEDRLVVSVHTGAVPFGPRPSARDHFSVPPHSGGAVR